MSIRSVSNADNTPVTANPGNSLKISSALKRQIWLAQVASLAQSASTESIISLGKLIDMAPDADDDEVLKKIIDEVNELVQRKQFDPTLTPNSKEALVRIHLSASNANETVKAARKLSF